MFEERKGGRKKICHHVFITLWLLIGSIWNNYRCGWKFWIKYYTFVRKGYDPTTPSNPEMTENEIVGCHHQLDGHEFEQTPGIGDGQGSLACCSPWGCKESDMTERLKWTELTTALQTSLFNSRMDFSIVLSENQTFNMIISSFLNWEANISVITQVDREKKSRRANPYSNDCRWQHHHISHPLLSGNFLINTQTFVHFRFFCVLPLIPYWGW